MKLDETFRIEPDDRSWNLVRRISEARDKDKNLKFDENGNQLWNEDTTYHANLKQALSAYLDAAIKPASKDAETLLNAIARVEKKIEEAQ